MSIDLPHYSQEQLNAIASTEDYSRTLALAYDRCAHALNRLQSCHADYHKHPERKSTGLSFHAALLSYEAAKAFVTEVKDLGLKTGVTEWMV